MSQPRMRKVVSSGDDKPRARPSAAKASGDSVACTVRPNQETLRSRSKNKIPKSVRYDLENALVSLCDVWFEEIKPHLVRNNIKLHVHGSSASGDHELRPAAAAAKSRATPAPAALGCSHLDPASSAPGCELCRLLFNAANCIESAVCQAASAQSPPPVAATVAAADSSRLHSEKRLKRPRTRRKKRRSQPQPQSSWRVPRLCRTYSVLCPAATGSRMRRIASHQPPQPPRQHYFRFIAPRHQTVARSKSTQTEKERLVSVGCQWEQPGEVHRRGSRSPHRRSPTSRGPALRSPESRSPAPRRPASRSPAPRSPALFIPASRSPGLLRPAPRSPAPSSPAKRSLPVPIRPSCIQVCVSPRASPPRTCTYRLQRPEPPVVEKLPLFQDDLIDIIGERNDMRLRLLYSSPRKEEYPSFMNLVPLPSDRQKKPGGLKKNPPWR